MAELCHAGKLAPFQMSLSLVEHLFVPAGAVLHIVRREVLGRELRIKLS